MKRALLIAGGIVLLIGTIGALTSPRDSASRASPRQERSAPMPESAPAPDRWEQFTQYAPALGEIIQRSDRFNERIAAGHTLGLPRGEQYRLVDEAAEMNGIMKAEAQGVRVPREANAFKQAVYEAVRSRETAYNRQKAALDRPSAQTEAALSTARQEAERRAEQMGVALLELCQALEAERAECFAVAGIGES